MKLTKSGPIKKWALKNVTCSRRGADLFKIRPSTLQCVLTSLVFTSWRTADKEKIARNAKKLLLPLAERSDAFL